MNTTAALYLPFVQESIAGLGYIKPEFDMALATMLEVNEGVNPVEIARIYRKNGEQLAADEKRALGLRSNAFFSREALESLTEKGRSHIKDAHANTLLRAMFGFFRARTIASANKADIHLFKVMPSHEGCPACERLKGQVISSNEAAALFPPPDCAREACSVVLMPWKDFLAGVT
jgi:hypothetical protein